MANPERLVTTVSTKGQVTLPSAIRKRRQWGAGTRLLVEDTPEGVLLRSAPAFAATRSEDVFASLPHSGKPKTLKEMDAGVLAAARPVRTTLKP
ncbi:MAG: AbrB family transcriptional regulator [Mesorhizobium sp.]|uniref:AbrB/MazE/SpoVT family DNA-binding domain-containing protein n=1 Tax=unclassified Mesorhizobium TaxID=325217 RepID=UPI000FE55E89|nr:MULTISPECIES: AbrB/MazE/SpoVT family DNA-binding domain-containing protein [unclassified Mesorhizobium]RWB30193.1 MAG: AbrB family transcriptional regulator [Mesorhizobium sp.]RWB35596.1 MAG: AbrB family transcriptional regulator [Mesorhizobium sp.]RWB79341.1 MAG: AbrB family transcriptional regulator [Mesorhizobium sp.]RWC03036.1 MAG: AbrB family transcriptional regulator [Mesorhizobium sp.]RWD21603.1 MAG: AbrB family transcriptional regulator [Mesorhizobium sp.]